MTGLVYGNDPTPRRNFRLILPVVIRREGEARVTGTPNTGSVELGDGPGRCTNSTPALNHGTQQAGSTMVCDQTTRSDPPPSNKAGE